MRTERRLSTESSAIGIRILPLAAALLMASALQAQDAPPAQTPAPQQAPSPDVRPIAIIALDSKNPDQAAKVTGALEVARGSAVIVGSGSITAGDRTTQVVLPARGTLRVCASTTVKLSSDSSVKAPEVPGLMMAMEHGAIEASYATGRSSDFLLTPDFRILIGGPGAVELKVRLGQHGDTCVDNAGINAPYVLVTSIFDGGVYRVQPGQRVMFQHGSLKEVVDDEKEPCGCPPPPDAANGNEFPLAVSEGLAPLPAAAPGVAKPGEAPPAPIPPLVYKAAEPAPVTAEQPAATPPALPPAPKKKPGFFAGVKSFFRRIFGAE